MTVSHGDHPALAALLYIKTYVRDDPWSILVAQGIAANVGIDGRARIGQRRLAKQCACDTATVNRRVAALEAAGHLQIERGGQGLVYKFPTGDGSLFAGSERSATPANGRRLVVVVVFLYTPPPPTPGSLRTPSRRASGTSRRTSAHDRRAGSRTSGRMPTRSGAIDVSCCWRIRITARRTSCSSCSRTTGSCPSTRRRAL